MPFRRFSEKSYRYALSKEGAENRDPDLFSKRLFEDKAGGLLPLEIGSLTSNLIGGGIDTTTSKMLSFILASIAFPDTVKKAQLEELKKVVEGSDFRIGKMRTISHTAVP